jgi:hypothetical protein
VDVTSAIRNQVSLCASDLLLLLCARDLFLAQGEKTNMRPDCHLDITALAYTQKEQLLSEEHWKRAFSQKHSVAWFAMMFLIGGGMLVLIPWKTWSIPLLILGSLLPIVLFWLLFIGIRRYLNDGIRQAIQKKPRF